VKIISSSSEFKHNTDRKLKMLLNRYARFYHTRNFITKYLSTEKFFFLKLADMVRQAKATKPISSVKLRPSITFNKPESVQFNFNINNNSTNKKKLKMLLKLKRNINLVTSGVRSLVDMKRSK